MSRHIFTFVVVVLGCASPIGAQMPAPDQKRDDPIGLLGELMGRNQRIRPRHASLTPDETKAQAVLRRIVAGEIATCKRTSRFPAAKPFASGKESIQQSPSFGILRRMPKGGALHIHSSAAGRAEWIVSNASYRPDCYVYWPDAGTASGGHVQGELGFFNPGRQPQGFRTTEEVRKAVPDFDRQLLALITLGPEDEQCANIWDEFSNCFQRIGGLLSYQPVFADYFVDAFDTLIADGVDYVELRTGLGSLSDLTGKRWEGEAFIEQYLALRDKVRAKHPEFDLKLIIAGYRFSSLQDVRKDIWQTFPLRKRWPDFVLGYDLVGEEDTGNPISLYFHLLMEVSFFPLYFGIDMPLYLHDGETLWRDESNIRGAYMLRARRVGHGLNLFYFPALERNFVRRKVPLEICPVSNQTLRYVSDLRLHPANLYLKRGVTCVLSSDDPGILGNDGLSYDFWEALLAWELDLADLKLLALNSIDYSARSTDEKRIAKERWQQKWNVFIRDLAGYKVPSPQAAGRPASP